MTKTQARVTNKTPARVTNKTQAQVTKTQAHGPVRVVELYPQTYRFALMLLLFSSAIFQQQHLHEQHVTLNDVMYLVNNGLKVEGTTGTIINF